MSAARLRLLSISFAFVEFALVDQGGDIVRRVVVRVGCGSSWRQAVQFPTPEC